MSLHSIATAGLRTIDQISYRHDLRFHRKQNGLAITIELTTSSLPGAPVVDDKGNFIGFISEFDILNILETGRELGQLTAEEIMVQDHVCHPGIGNAFGSRQTHEAPTSVGPPCGTEWPDYRMCEPTEPPSGVDRIGIWPKCLLATRKLTAELNDRYYKWGILGRSTEKTLLQDATLSMI